MTGCNLHSHRKIRSKVYYLVFKGKIKLEDAKPLHCPVCGELLPLIQRGKRK